MPKTRARPDPISCQLCRAKKLKCNRVQPCSNCLARGVTCHFLVPPPNKGAASSNSLYDRDVLRRLEFLESKLQSGSVQGATRTLPVSNGSPTSRVRGDDPSQANTTTSNSIADDDVVFDIVTREDSFLFSLSDILKFRLCTVQEIIDPADRLPYTNIVENGCNIIVIKLPVYSTALLLFQSFESNHDHLCRLMHIPTIKAMMKSVYLRVNQRNYTQPGHVALLLSIFAIAAFFYHPLENPGIASTKDEAYRLSKALTKGALDALDHSRRTSPGNLEDIQGYIIMYVLLQYLDGFSARARQMLASAALIAKDLRLHRVDAGTVNTPSHSHETNIPLLIDREVKRRVMWYIATSEWLSAALPGPQSGTYSIHPNQLSLKLPKVCADDDVGVGGATEPATGPQPTGQTFFLENIRLAQICWDIVDTVPLETPQLMQMPYERIRALDKNLLDFEATMPYFFKTDTASRERTKSLEPIYPSIPLWRYCIATAMHVVRCRLHQRFLLRQSLDERFTYSRQACLGSARTVAQVYIDMSTAHPMSSLMARMGKAVQLVHSALVILITDYCLNDKEKDEAELSFQIRPVLNVFGAAKGVSALAAKALTSLYGLLRKHRILLTELPESTAQHTSQVNDTPQQSVQLGIDETYANHLDFALDDLWSIQSPFNFDIDAAAGYGSLPGLDQTDGSANLG